MSDGPSSVRIELVEDAARGTEAPDSGVPPAPDRRTRIAAAVVLAALVGGLWLLARPESGTDAARDPLTPTTTAPVEPDDPASTGADVLDSFWRNRPELAADLIVDTDDGWMAFGRPLPGDAGGVFTSDDGLDWRREEPSLPGVEQVLDVDRALDRIRLLVSTVVDEGQAEASSRLSVLSSADGREWAVERAGRGIAVPGWVRKGSVYRNSWVVASDRSARSSSESLQMGTVLFAGTMGSEELHRIEVGPDEFVGSFAAVDGGFVAVVLRLDFGRVNAFEVSPPSRVVRWTPAGGFEPLASLPVRATPTPEFVDAGDLGVLYLSGDEVYGVDVPTGETWSLRASRGVGEATRGGAITPAGGGIGYLATEVDPADGAVTAYLSADGARWHAESLGPVRDVGLLVMTRSHAVVEAERDGIRQLRRLDIGPDWFADDASPIPPSAPEFRVRTIEEGGWSLPVLSARVGGPGFVGLITENGTVRYFESPDGLDWTASEPTDLPFGFLARRLEPDPVGYRVVGRTGLLEDSAYLSADGLRWERVRLDLPRGADIAEVAGFSATATGRSVQGSIGWADDLGRTEALVQWWSGDGPAIEVPSRVCREFSGRCAVVDIAARETGVTAIHTGYGDPRAVLSEWSPAEGWQTLTLDPEPMPARLAARPTGVWYLGTSWAGLVSGPDAVERRFTTPPGASGGGFIAVSDDESAVVYRSDTDMFVGSDRGWRRYPLENVVVGELLAFDADGAIFRGVGEDGAGLIRFRPAV